MALSMEATLAGPAVDDGSLPSTSASTSESENCGPGLWLPWIMCWNSGHSQLYFCDTTHLFDQRPSPGSHIFWYFLDLMLNVLIPNFYLSSLLAVPFWSLKKQIDENFSLEALEWHICLAPFYLVHEDSQKSGYNFWSAEGRSSP